MQTRELADLYRRIRELPSGEREAAIDLACGDDFMARARLVKLLRNARPASRAELLGADPTPDTLGDYRIERLIARGGMATVYEGRDAENSRVAIKVLRSSSDSSDALLRFKREVEILTRLNHPSIARIHSYGATEEGFPYIVMGFVEGRTVTGHALGTREAGRIEILARICDAVEYAHSNSVVHRDLKPGNVLVTDPGDPIVLDFGIARCAQSEEWQTLDGTILGTAAYMSPEQALGLALDHRTDIYSIGVIAHEVLTGIHPAAELKGASQLSTLISPAGLPCTVPGPMGGIVARAMATDREDRFASAAELASALRTALLAQFCPRS